jgi:hypothetical protein
MAVDRRGAERGQADSLLSPARVAAMIGVQARTLRTWRYRSRGPAFVRFSRTCVRYDPADVAAWIERHRTAGEMPMA